MLQILAIERCATFDPLGHYRYSLGRRWSAASTLAIIMLNPSQADGSLDDPTLRRCIGLAQGWGFGAITVVNLFAYRSPHPQVLRQVADPVGPENDRVVAMVVDQADQVLLAWGNGGSWRGRDHAVLNDLAPYHHKFHCLGQNRTGQPRHPLYMPRQVPLLPWPSWPSWAASSTPGCRQPGCLDCREIP